MQSAHHKASLFSVVFFHSFGESSLEHRCLGVNTWCEIMSGGQLEFTLFCNIKKKRVFEVVSVGKLSWCDIIKLRSKRQIDFFFSCMIDQHLKARKKTECNIQMSGSQLIKSWVSSMCATWAKLWGCDSVLKHTQTWSLCQFFSMEETNARQIMKWI